MPKKIESPELTNDIDLENHGIFLLYDEITIENTSEAIKFILKSNLSKNKLKNLTLIINSSGGDLNSSFALIDIMKGSKIPIYTIGLGEISSASLLIFMSGERGHRLITPNTSILSHQFTWGKEGKEHELLAALKEFNLTSERMLNHYKKCTKLSEKKIKEVLMPPTDVYLDAKEAVSYNIADQVIDTYEFKT
jgi:ATP-dependent Clp protease, protease subunit